VSHSPPLSCVFVALEQYAGSQSPDCAGHVATSAYTIVDQLDNWRGDIGVGMAGGGCADRIQTVKCGTFPPSLSQPAQADSAQSSNDASTAASEHSSAESVHTCVMAALGVTVMYGELERSQLDCASSNERCGRK